MSQLFPPATAGVNPLGFQQILAATLAASTPLTVPDGATYALIQVDTAPVRWRGDGVAPTATIGMSMGFGAEPQGFAGDLDKLHFIAQSGAPIMNISYYG